MLMEKFDALSAPLPRPDVLYGVQPTQWTLPSLSQLHHKPPAYGRSQYNGDSGGKRGGKKNFFELVILFQLPGSSTLASASGPDARDSRA